MITVAQKWNKTILSDIADITSSKRIFASDYVSEGIPFYRSREIIEKQRGNNISTELYISKEKYESIKNKFGVPKQGDILITSVGTLGVPYVVSANEVFYFKDGNLIWLRDFKKDKADPKFIYYVILNPETQQRLKGISIGSSQSAFTISALKDFDVLLPDLSSQEKVVDVLASYDAFIKNNARRIDILEQLAQAVYTEWFVNFRFPGHEKVKMVNSGTNFGEIPEGWEVKMIGDVCTRIQAGGTPRRGKDEYWNNGTISWYTTGELQDNFLFGSKEKITEQSIDETSAKIFDKGTILMAIYGSPTVGRLGITTERSSCNQAALGLVEDSKKITKTYLYYVLRNLRERFNLEAVVAAQQNISKIKVSETRCLVADRDLIDQFDVIAFPIFQEIESLQRQNDVLRQTRDLLLPKLVTGEIEVSPI